MCGLGSASPNTSIWSSFPRSKNRTYDNAYEQFCDASRPWSHWVWLLAYPVVAFFALGLNLRKFFLIRSAGTRMPRSFYLQIMTLVNILLFIPFTYVFLQKILADVDLIVDEKPWVERENSARLTRYALFFPKQFLILAFTSETYDYRDVERCLHTSFCEPYLLTIIMDLISLWLILFSDCTVVYYGLERLRCLMNSFARLGRPYFRGALIFTCAFGFLIAVGALLSRYWLYLHLEKRNLVVFEDMVQMAREYHASLEKKSSYQVLENKHADLKFEATFPLLIQFSVPFIIRASTFFIFMVSNLYVFRRAWIHRRSRIISRNEHRRYSGLWKGSHVLTTLVLYLLGHGPRLVFHVIDYLRSNRLDFLSHSVFSYCFCVLDDLSKFTIVVYYGTIAYFLAPIPAERSNSFRSRREIETHPLFRETESTNVSINFKPQSETQL